MKGKRGIRETLLSIGGAYLLAFAAVMAVTFARGYMVASMDAGDADSANILMIFGILFGIAPGALLFVAVIAELRDEE
jgi:hypothetical protein|tara:strand:+ start:186 stop:419 length:234 start_codon:yes stop_codon:yes gene_type:complete